MSKPKSRVFRREFKLAAVHRMLAGENVSALSRELKVRRKDLYKWRDHFRLGGPDALRAPGRPRKGAVVAPAAASNADKTAEPDASLAAAQARIAELERKVGQQQIDIDFFRAALRQVEGTRRTNAKPGVMASTKSSKR
jgi:transposase-like protein